VTGRPAQAVKGSLGARLRPVIDQTFPFAEAKAAYRYFGSSGDLFHAGSGGIDQRSRGIDLLLIERAAREAQSQREL